MKPLNLAVTAYLVFAIVLDSSLFLMSWLAPDLWFTTFHGHSVADPYATLLLRRAGGHWLAFAIVQVLVLWRKDQEPWWLAVAAGLRWSDAFTDVSYVVGASDLSLQGWVSLLPPPVLNVGGGIMFLAAFRASVGSQEQR